MMSQLRQLLSVLVAHKFKVVLMLMSAVIFAFLLFPFDDLGDLVTSQVAKFTNNQVFVSFDRMEVGVINPGLQLQNVYLETSAMPPISAQEISVRPAFSMLVNKKPAGSLSAHGLMKGDLDLKLSPAGKSEAGVEKQKISITAKKISLAELRELVGIPLTMKGRVDISSQATADLTFTEQPDMDIQLHIDKFELPTGNVQTGMGPLTLPEIKLTSLDLKGRLSSGQFHIEDGQIGKDNDLLRGTVTGNLALQLKNTPGGIIPIIGGYDFSVRLTVKKDLQDRATLFLSFLDNYKSPQPDGALYSFKLSAPNTYTPPSLGALR